ncbi:hypothetical protein M3Y98_00017200 [Aphelenchoides besseyi]|nr:hypothetical protein M3Y98_00017200 [Aphelenchoides besseyi]
MLGIIRNNLRSMLHEIEWLDESARVGLIQKLDAFNYVVGYDMNLYNDTLIQQLANQIDILADDSFPKLRRKTVEAELKFESMRVRGQLQIRGKELEPDFVFMINAFYEPTTHTVNIPMGYQLDPFF